MENDMVFLYPNRFNEFPHTDSVFIPITGDSILERIDTTKEKVERCITNLKKDEHWKGFLGDLEQEWEGDTLVFSFSLIGSNVRGAITIEDGIVRIHTNDAEVVRVLQSAIQDILT
jgi:hypothetical protein